MKKSFIFAAFAMGMAMVSCDNVDLPNPPAQSNPQDPTFDASGIEVVADPAAATEVYDLTALQNEGALVPVAVVAKAENIPSGCELKFSGRASLGTNFSGKEFACEVVDNTVMVSPDVLNGIIRSELTKAPGTYQVNLRLNPYIQSATNEGFVAQLDVTYGAFPLQVTVFDPEYVIEPVYYLLTSTDLNTWNAVASTHSDNNVYDDPKFTFVFDCVAANIDAPLYWKVLPESVYKTNPDATTFYAPLFEDSYKKEGKLEMTIELGMNIEVTGSVVMTINMETLTYSYMGGFTQLYTPGASNGWDAASSQILTTNDYVNFSGYVNLTGDFKFNPDAGWNGRDFGCNDPFTYGGDPVVGTGLADGGNNINVDVPGIYFAQLDYSTRETTLTNIATMGLIGSATDGGWDTSTAMTMTSPLVYTVETHLKAEEFKFRANNGWDINLGGDIFNLVAGGDNIKVDVEGDYTVTLDLSIYPYSCTLVKK